MSSEKEFNRETIRRKLEVNFVHARRLGKVIKKMSIVLLGV